MNEFFENAAEKARAAFDVVVKKTDEVVTNGKYMIDIASLENKLKKLYEEMGKLYFESVQDSTDKAEELSLKVEEIKTKLAEIAEAKEENAKAGGKKVCPACGGYTDKKSSFCSKCGNKFGE